MIGYTKSPSRPPPMSTTPHPAQPPWTRPRPMAPAAAWVQATRRGQGPPPSRAWMVRLLPAPAPAPALVLVLVLVLGPALPAPARVRAPVLSNQAVLRN